MQTFTDHFRICLDKKGQEWPSVKLTKEIGSEGIKHIAAALEELRANGYYPLDINDHGGIVWGIPVKSELQVHFEEGLSEYQKMSMDELCKIGRGGFKRMVKGSRK